MTSWIVAASAGLGLILAAAPVSGGGAPAALPQPSLTAACNAWREHVSGLLDQHRRTGDTQEAVLFRLVQQFIAARDACRPGSYELGLRRYEAIPLGRVQEPLR